MRRARMWVNGFAGPHLVVGDFNTPPESLNYRSVWSDWQNAFSSVGRGFGGAATAGCPPSSWVIPIPSHPG